MLSLRWLARYLSRTSHFGRFPLYLTSSGSCNRLPRPNSNFGLLWRSQATKSDTRNSCRTCSCWEKSTYLGTAWYHSNFERKRPFFLGLLYRASTIHLRILRPLGILKFWPLCWDWLKIWFNNVRFRQAPLLTFQPKLELFSSTNKVSILWRSFWRNSPSSPRTVWFMPARSLLLSAPRVIFFCNLTEPSATVNQQAYHQHGSRTMMGLCSKLPDIEEIVELSSVMLNTTAAKG